MSVLVGAVLADWNFGVGIHSFCGRGGGSHGCRSFGLVLCMSTVVFISATFSPIGALLRELRYFLCLWAARCLVCNRDDAGLVLE